MRRKGEGGGGGGPLPHPPPFGASRLSEAFGFIGHLCPPGSGGSGSAPAWPSIWIHSEMSNTGRAICAPPPSQLGGARVPSFRRSSLACYKFRDVWHRPGHLCPPPSQTMGGARGPLPIPAFNPFRDVSQAGPPVPPSQKLGGARVLSFRRSSLVEMPDTSRFAHFTPLINWLINASREGT